MAECLPGVCEDLDFQFDPHQHILTHKKGKMAKVKVERERASINLKSMCTGKHTAHLPTHTCTYMGKGIFTHMYLLSYKGISEEMIKNPYHM